MTTAILDVRELIPMDYKQTSTEQLEALKTSLMHSIQAHEAGLTQWHREYTAIRLELATRTISERQPIADGEAS